MGFAKTLHVEYLGITISDDLDWGQHISEMAEAIRTTVVPIRILIRTVVSDDL